MERKWRLTGLNGHYLAWKDLICDYRALIETERSSYFSQTIENNQGNPRHLFQTINRLLKVDAATTLPVSQQLNSLNFLTLKLIVFANKFLLHLLPLSHFSVHLGLLVFLSLIFHMLILRVSKGR